MNTINIAYFDSLPEVENKYKVELANGEKVVFTTKLLILGTDKQRALGDKGHIVLTNQRLFLANGYGAEWCVDLSDVVDFQAVEEPFLFVFKNRYFAVNFSKELECDYTRMTMTKTVHETKLSGFVFTMEKTDSIKFEEIVKNLSN